MEQRVAGRSTAGIVGAVGGLLAVVGSVLVWFSVKADTSSLGGQVMTNSVKGTDASDGKVTLVAGLIVIGVGLAIALGWAARARRGLSVLVILAGAAAGGLALYDVLTAKSQVIDAAVDEVGNAGLGVGQVRGLLEEAFDTGILKITPGIGIILVIAGGALALVAGVMGVASRAEPVPAVAEPVPPMPTASPQAPPAPAVWADAPGPEDASRDPGAGSPA